jgi:hypothetical protein
MHDLKEIYDLFLADGTFLDGIPVGSGHIHDTYKIETAEKDKDDYILQRLNSKVFRRIPEMQENIERVTTHIREKLRSIPGADIKRNCLTLVSSKGGKSWIIDKDGSYWRMYVYITDYRSYDIVDSPDKAYEGGKATGRFQAMLADLPGELLHETIPSFHDTGKRLQTFFRVVEADPVKRCGKLAEEIRFVRDRAEKMKIILQLGREGKIPLRITHNDTKFNNVLLDKDDKALCLIDLDTVMPGYVHYDFGDAIRTAANTAAEDEAELSRVAINISLYEAYAEGYLSEAGNTLNSCEKEYLAFAPQLITFEQGVRFLTDYLEGDPYYKIHHEHHNLQRARAQFKLVSSMEENYARMQDIVRNLG